MSLSPAASDPTFESDPRFADPIAAAPSVNRGDNAFWGEDGLQFGDVLDSINPLQHIPLVSSLYREITGDQIPFFRGILVQSLIKTGLGYDEAYTLAQEVRDKLKDIEEVSRHDLIKLVVNLLKQSQCFWELRRHRLKPKVSSRRLLSKKRRAF